MQIKYQKVIWKEKRFEKDGYNQSFYKSIKILYSQQKPAPAYECKRSKPTTSTSPPTTSSTTPTTSSTTPTTSSTTPTLPLWNCKKLGAQCTITHKQETGHLTLIECENGKKITTSETS